MKIAICQSPGEPGAVLKNLETMEAVANAAAEKGAHLLVFPEMFLSGYNIAPQVEALAEAMDGPAAQTLRRVAQKHQMALLYGYPEREGDSVYNSVQLLDGTGASLANYRKVHLYGEMERAMFSPGNAPPTLVDLHGIRLGSLICYDVEFPEAVRYLALRGAELVVVPTALMEPVRFIPETLVPTRAWENQIFMAYANRCGEENGMRYVGLSSIVAPDGGILAKAGNAEELLFADVQPRDYAQSRKDNPYLLDCRRELFPPPNDK